MNLTPEAYEWLLENARLECGIARTHWEAAKGKVRREAAEALEFWTSRVAFIEAGRC